MSKKEYPSQVRLKELLSYNPDTGVFTCIVSRGNRTAGSEAGTRELTRSPRDWYIDIKINSVKYRANRLAFLYMTGNVPEHIYPKDGNGHNNAWNNLVAA